jgi:hypothetical protein
MMMEVDMPRRAPGAPQRRTSLPPLQPAPPAPRLRMLRAAFGREFRAVFPAAFLFLFIAFWLMGLLLWDSLHPKPQWINLRDNNLFLEQSTQPFLAIWFLITGTILGACQANQQLSDSQWGFLKHRPAGPGLLFAARLLAGLALYGIAAGTPFAAALLYGATHGIPFDWHFTLPSIADFLNGLVYYLAGLLIVQRQASFFGSRLVPLIGALACTVLVTTVSQFAYALLVLGVVGLIYGTAALAALNTNGFRVRVPAAARLALGVVLLGSLSLPLALLSTRGVEWAVEVARVRWEAATSQSFRSPDINALRRQLQITARYVLLPDATLGREIYTASPSGYPGSYVARFERLDGTPYFTRLEPRTMPDGTVQDVEVVDVPPLSYVYSAEPYQDETSAYRQQKVTQVYKGVPNGEQWWYVESTGLFQGYDQQGRYLGSIGQDGFAPPGRHAARFRPNSIANIDAPDAKSSFRLFTQRSYFEVDLGKRTVSPVFLIPEGKPIVGYAWLERAPDTSLVVVAKDRLYLYGRETSIQPVRTVPLDRTPTPGSRIGHIPQTHQWAIWYRSDRRIDLYDDQWHLVSHLDVPAVDAGPANPPAPEWYQQARAATTRDYAWRVGMIRAACNWPFQELLRAMGLSRLLESDLPSDSAWYQGFFSIDPAYTASPWYLGPFAVTLLAAAAAMGLLARRYGLRWRWAWIAGTLAFGPVMLLVLPALYILPRTVPCPQCGRRRLPQAPRCGHCRAAWSAAPATGTEIFTASTGGAA